MYKKGFTLIELLVVIAIIGILASIVMVSLNSARSKARDARRVSDLQTIKTALELYYSDNGSYPHNITCGGSGSNLNVIWSSWSCWSSFVPSQYFSSGVPADPLNTDLGNCQSTQNCHIYEYCALNSGQGYLLAVNLENTPFQSLGNNSSCPTGGPNYYWTGSQ